MAWCERQVAISSSRNSSNPSSYAEGTREIDRFRRVLDWICIPVRNSCRQTAKVLGPVD